MANSYALYNGDGVQTDWVVPFPYLDPSHVEVLANGNSQTYVWLNSGTVRLSPAAAVGVVVEVRRRTPITPLVTYADGITQTADDLNRACLQGLYLGQEARDEADRYQEFETDASNSATASAGSAAAAAATLVSFEEMYLGAHSSAPTTDNFGNTLQPGALYINPTTLQWFGWTGSAWLQLPSPSTVLTFAGRTGNVSPAAHDYNAGQIDFTPTGLANITATNTQSAMAQLDSAISAKRAFDGSTVFPTSSNYTLATTEKGNVIALNWDYNASGNLIIGAANTYTSGAFFVENMRSDSCQLIALAGVGNLKLYPGQSKIIFRNGGGTWDYLPKKERWASNTVTLYVQAGSGFSGQPGNDNNDGLSAARPLATIAYAVQVCARDIDTQQGPPTIKLMDGTHDVGGGCSLNYSLVGGSQIYITGNQTTPDNVVVSCAAGGNCFALRDGSVTLTLSYMKLRTVGNGSSLLNVSQFAVLDLIGITFDAAPLGMHLVVNTLASVNFLGNYKVVGGAVYHINASKLSYVNYGSFTVTGVSGLTFTYWIGAFSGAIVSCGGAPMSFTGFTSFSGTQWVFEYGAVKDLSGGPGIPGASGIVVAGGIDQS